MPNSSGYFTPRREVSFFLCTMQESGRYGDTAFLTSIVSPLCAALPPAHPSPYPPCPMGRGIWWSVAGLTRACGVLPFPAFLTLYPCLFVMEKRRREITIISFSRSICRGRLAALIGVTGKPYPSCLSCHSHPIRPCGHLPLEGKAAIREYHLLKKAAKPPPQP